MLQALSVPSGRTLAIAGLALGLTVAVGAARHRCHHHHQGVTHRLALHAVDRPDSVYLTAFRDGDFAVTFDHGTLEPFQIDVTGRLYGCEVLGIETLVPVDEHTFSYDYQEEVLHCDPGALQIIKTPRTGTVTVVD